MDADGIPIRTDGPALSPRADIDDLLARTGAVRRDVAAVSAAVLAVLAARAVAAGRTLAGPEPLYLRAPDVTLPRSAAARPPGAAG